MSLIKTTPMKVSIENHGIKVTVELPWDSDLENIFTAIKGALVAISWNPDSIDDYIIQTAIVLNEIKELNTKNKEDETED